MSTLACLQIKGYSPLVDVAVEEIEALLDVRCIARKGWYPATGVSLRSFDLNNIRAQVAEQLGTVSASAIGEVQNAVAGESTLLLSLHSCSFAKSDLFPLTFFSL
jgi:hypothetical protein